MLKLAAFGSVPRETGVCPRNSDFKPYEPRAVAFDERTYTYGLDTTFDHDMWQAELESRQRNGPTLSPEQKSLANKKQKDDIRKKIVDFVT